MVLPHLNTTESAQVLEALFESAASHSVPLLLLETFMLGVLCACVPLATYILWIRPNIVSRIPSISLVWLALIAMIIHWTLSLREIERALNGRSLGIFVSNEKLWNAINSADRKNDWPSPSQEDLVGYSYSVYAQAWLYLFPLITETALFGFASFLFATTAYRSFWQNRSQGYSWSNVAIPVMASLMYVLSLAHWAVSLRCFTVSAYAAPTARSFSIDTLSLDLALLVLLSLNAVLSDSIVLWRMYAVWERARPILVCGVTLLFITLCLNIANIVSNARGQLAAFSNGVAQNTKDTELTPTYGGSRLGLAAAFMSLISNLCATTLVAIRVWLYSTHYTKHLRDSNGSTHTLVQRFMELLVDSGVAYTTIWILFCASFFHRLTSYTIYTPGPTDPYPTITAASHLDAAMAQLTSIYPLTVFILVALDKIHHSQGPRSLSNDSWPWKREPVVAVTLEVDVERNVPMTPTSASPMLMFHSVTGSPSTSDAKLPGLQHRSA
ncbi:unnamed protein product [Peniophora sp. CBMAI 1063]|nr:unnamed protein product [Peniophora sp. CBMAI 1063]